MERSFWINRFCNCNALSTRRGSGAHTSVVSRSMIRLGSGKEHKTHSYRPQTHRHVCCMLRLHMDDAYSKQDPVSIMKVLEGPTIPRTWSGLVRTGPVWSWTNFSRPDWTIGPVWSRKVALIARTQSTTIFL